MPAAATLSKTARGIRLPATGRRRADYQSAAGCQPAPHCLRWRKLSRLSVCSQSSPKLTHGASHWATNPPAGAISQPEFSSKRPANLAGAESVSNFALYFQPLLAHLVQKLALLAAHFHPAFEGLAVRFPRCAAGVFDGVTGFAAGPFAATARFLTGITAFVSPVVPGAGTGEGTDARA